MITATFENKIVIVFTLAGFIIGRIAEDIVSNPKRLVMKQEGEKTMVEIRNMIGDPEIFFINGSPYYFSEDSSLNELYIESVTGIKVVKPGVIL
jgi:hypothetical protein